MLRFHLKTIFTILMIILTLMIVNSSPALAQDTAAPAQGTATPGAATTPSASENYLKDIRDTLLININQLPVYLKQLTEMALSWLAPDDSSTTATLQNSFTDLFNAKLDNAQTQSTSQKKFLTDFLGKDKDGNPLPQTDLLNANDITYQTLLNQPYFNPDSRPNVDPAYTYTQYASGLNIRHPQLSLRGRKRDPSMAMYTNYYNTTSAVQTYNGYILSALYADAKNNNLSRQIQDSLIQQSTNSNWFTQIASENLGIVLRQILLYNSQTYVLLAQLLETQKKLLASQVMNNALLIAVNLEAENRIYSKASGQIPL